MIFPRPILHLVCKITLLRQDPDRNRPRHARESDGGVQIPVLEQMLAALFSQAEEERQAERPGDGGHRDGPELG
jgi:hypothetical protein